MATTLPEISIQGDAAAPPPPQPAPAPVDAGGIRALSTAPGKVAIRDEDGSVSQIRQEDLPAAMAEGARPASEVDVFRAQNGALGTGMAGATGVLRGATFGLSDPLLVHGEEAIEGHDEAEKMRRVLALTKEAHPEPSFGGEVVGSLAPLLLTGGASEAVSAPGLLRTGAKLAGEGAVYGAGGQISEDTLGDHATTAEKLASSALGGAVFNVLLGGALHKGASLLTDGIGTFATKADAELARGLETYGAKDVESLAEKQFGEAGPGLGDRVRKELVKVSAALSGKDADTLDRFTRDFMKPGAEGYEARRVANFDAEKEIADAQRSLRTDGDAFVRETPEVMREFRGEMKADHVARLVKSGNEEEVAAYAKKKIADVIAATEAELTHANGVAPQTVKSLEQISRSAYHADAAVSQAIERGENVNQRAFMALDGLKRDVQGLTDGGYRRVAAMTDPFEARLARRTTDTMNAMQEDLRKGLEDADLWGKAGEVQADINAKWSKQIEASKRFHQALTTEIGRDPANPFLKQRGIDPAKLDAYSRNLMNPSADLTHQAVKDYVDATEGLAKTMRENLALPPEQLARIEKIQKAAGSFRSTLDKTEKTLTTVNQFKHITGKNADSVAGMASALGFAAGGPLGGAIGTAVGTAMNPGKLISQMAAIERMSTKLDGRLGKAARGLLGGGEKAAAAAPEARKVTADEVRELRQIVTNPAAVRARVAAAVAPFQETAPKVAQALGTTLLRVAGHLARELPAETRPGVVLGKQPPAKLSDVQLAKAESVIHSVDSVDGLLHGMSKGQVTKEQVWGLKQAYPALYEALKTAVRREAANLEPELTSEQEVSLSLLFGEPITDMMKPERIRSWQEAFGGAESITPKGGGPPGAQGAQAMAPKAGRRPLAHAGGTSGTAWDALERGDGTRS